MPMDIDTIKAVVSLMRSQGVCSFKLDGMEVTFSPATEAQGDAVGMDALPTEAVTEMTEEQIGPDGLTQAQRELLYPNA